MNNKIRLIVEGGLMIALATVLSYIKLYELPFGGSITLEMLPLVIMSLRNGTKWGLATALTHGVLQTILGFSNVLYCNTLISQIGCILLDYVLGFGVLGLADFFVSKKDSALNISFGAAVCGLLRFVCSFLSGWLLWGSYAPEGQAPIVYSLVYNASYMIPNIIILSLVCFALAKANKNFFHKN